MALRPIRCYTCGKVLLESMWNEFENQLVERDDELEMRDLLTKKFSKHGITRACCKVVLLSSVDHQNELQQFSSYKLCEFVEVRKDTDSSLPVRVYRCI